MSQCLPAPEHKEAPAAALILAAGASTRLGRPKQLVLFQGEPLLRRTVQLALTVGTNPVLVVADPTQPAVIAALSGLPVTIVPNAAPEEGMSASLRAGIAALNTRFPQCRRLLLLVCDQPRLRPEHLTALLRAPGSIAAAHYAGRLGVPAVFAREHFLALASTKGDQGARTLLRTLPVTAIPTPEAVFDVDTPEDLLTLDSLA